MTAAVYPVVMSVQDAPPLVVRRRVPDAPAAIATVALEAETTNKSRMLIVG